MNLEQIKNTISERIQTRQEIKASEKLIKESNGRVLMVAFDDENKSKAFGPRGYIEDEIDAIKREIKSGNRVVVSGLDGNGVVTIMNRK